MNFKDVFLYTNYRARLIDPILFIKKYIYKNKINLSNDFINLENRIKSYKKIVVVASGPSSRKLVYSKENLYITTNSSYLILPPEVSFIHILNDLGYLKKFSVFGLKYKPIITYIYAPYTKKLDYGYKVMTFVRTYIESKSFPIEIISQSSNLTVNNINIHDKLMEFHNSLEVKNPYGNSGLIILEFGLFLSKYLNIPIEVYGLDAGEGGKIYADGRKTHINHVAMRDKNKQIMGEYLDYLNTKISNYKNYSYFKGNIK